ncbi:hypothetical protein RRG08_049260 [Elysia crispata]|uniref:Uncharacterized protein n=1 Tax=Elysia crispata TaxID=231223 RepID=A0AAE1DK45_9GAST|nr:hypothetical protein RRG08_049260 [Elysia crispata]
MQVEVLGCARTVHIRATSFQVARTSRNLLAKNREGHGMESRHISDLDLVVGLVKLAWPIVHTLSFRYNLAQPGTNGFSPVTVGNRARNSAHQQNFFVVHRLKHQDFLEK